MTAEKLPKLLVLAMCLGIVTSSCFPLSVEAKQSKSGAKSSRSKTSESGDAATEVRAQLDALEKTLAQGTAKQLAAMWTEDGTYTDENGAIVKGRAALEERFAAIISDTGNPTVDFVPDSNRVLSNNVVLSEGIVRRKDGAKRTPETRYSLVLQKKDGAWLISAATETPFLASAEEDPLTGLAWMIGDWSATDKSKGASVEMKADWAANKHFITCNYVTQRSADSPKIESKQVIGWDPRTENPISWHFDSSGGFGYGNWSNKDGKWYIQSTGIDRDGSTTTATNIISGATPSSFNWQSIDRTVDGVSYTDTASLKVEKVVK